MKSHGRNLAAARPAFNDPESFAQAAFFSPFTGRISRQADEGQCKPSSWMLPLIRSFRPSSSVATRPKASVREIPSVRVGLVLVGSSLRQPPQPVFAVHRTSPQAVLTVQVICLSLAPIRQTHRRDALCDDIRADRGDVVVCLIPTPDRRYVPASFGGSQVRPENCLENRSEARR